MVNQRFFPGNLSPIGKLLALPLSASILAACGGDGGGDGQAYPQSEHVAVVKTRAADYSSGAQALIGTAPPYKTALNINASESDVTVRANGEHFYVLGRSGLNYVAKYDRDRPENPIWQFSVKELNLSGSNPNPHDLVFAVDDQAYLLQYGYTHAQVVDPTASSIGAFPAADPLDLTEYANVPGGDGYDAYPQMHTGIVVDDRLYIAMQRQIDDPDSDFSKIKKQAYIAVFKTSDNSEIDTTPADSSDLKGIPLTTRNPRSIHYDSANNQLVVASVGDYTPDGETGDSVSGGVETIDLGDTSCGDGNGCYSTNVLVDDSSGVGEVSDVAVVDGETAYLVGYKGYNYQESHSDSALYAFNPDTGQLHTDGNGDPAVIGGIGNVGIGDIAVSPGGKLWVSVVENDLPGMAVIDPADHSVIKNRVPTELYPGRIAFVSREAP